LKASVCSRCKKHIPGCANRNKREIIGANRNKREIIGANSKYPGCASAHSPRHLDPPLSV